MDINFVREAVTVLSFLAFVAILAYAIHPANRKRFDQAAQLPFDEDRPSPQPSPKAEGANVEGVFVKADINR